MKKIYALLALALVGSTSFAQRNIDIQLNLTTPVDGSTVAQTASQQVIFTFKNVGDDLIVGDTVVFYLYNFTTDAVFSLTGTPNGVNGVIIDTTAATAVNSGIALPSAAINQGAEFTFNSTAAGFNAGDNIMVIGEVWSADGALETQANFADNWGEFYLSAPVSAVANTNKISFKAFPVPAVNELNVVADEEVASISIISLDGKVVSTVAGNKADVSKLTSGVYVYEVTTVSGAKSVSKFVKK